EPEGFSIWTGPPFPSTKLSKTQCISSKFSEDESCEPQGKMFLVDIASQNISTRKDSRKQQNQQIKVRLMLPMTIDVALAVTLNGSAKSDYVVECGASRNFEPWRAEDEVVEKEKQKEGMLKKREMR
ncbi:hypothetical protein Leryth_025956, partial [Lithospermum erythrorhizon]